MAARRQNTRSRGRPRESIYTEPPPTAEKSMTFWLERQRADFEAQPAKMRAETLARVELILESERALWLSRPEGHRGTPSQLARVAYRVYGLWVDWLPASFQLRDSLAELPKSAPMSIKQARAQQVDREIAAALRAIAGEVVI